MGVRALSYKNWCTENISPQSWTRIVLKSSDIIRTSGYKLVEFEEPNDSLEVPTQILQSLNEALENLYELKAEEVIASF